MNPKPRFIVPELSRFYGIIIRMHVGDHPPPHFHALYGGQEASIDIDGISVSKGRLPPRARRLVIEWASLHQAELMVAWNRAQRLEAPGRIAPLE